VSNVWYLAFGFGAVWLLVAAYLLYLGHRQRRLAKRLEELEGPLK
jgi:CcmD family protein